jgi:NADP-dependent 3-hydroxy acid dehydrogenase YdfG
LDSTDQWLINSKEEEQMKKALVLGATGGMGYSIVKELIQREVEVVAFARTKEKLEEMFRTEPQVVIQPGDAFSAKAARTCCKWYRYYFSGNQSSLH